MLSVHARKPAAVIVDPVARALLRIGLTPNMVTVAGTLATITALVVLIPTGHLVWATALTALFAAMDLIDGTMARMRGGGTAFGATLDASCDRLTDGALFGAIAVWLIYTEQAHPSAVVACLIVLVFSQVISYIKARAEAGGLTVNGGLIERAERIIIALAGLFLQGVGVPNAVVVSLWVLVVGSAITVIQRLLLASRDPKASTRIAPPKGATDPASASE